MEDFNTHIVGVRDRDRERERKGKEKRKKKEKQEERWGLLQAASGSEMMHRRICYLQSEKET